MINPPLLLLDCFMLTIKTIKTGGDVHDETLVVVLRYLLGLIDITIMRNK